MRRESLLRGLSAVAFVLFAVLLWPTQWRVYAACPGYVRVHRFLPKAEQLTADGWQPYVPPRPVGRGFTDLADSAQVLWTRDSLRRYQTGIPDRP